VLGDFDIVSTEAEATPARLCVTGVKPAQPQGSRNFVASELNKPGMTEQLVCNDNVAVASYSPTGRRSLIEGVAKVRADAPAERLLLTQVDGNAALIVKPAAEDGPFFIYVIKRKPTQTARGVMVGLIDPTQAQAIQRARVAVAE
jgi:hypothetical protein